MPLKIVQCPLQALAVFQTEAAAGICDAVKAASQAKVRKAVPPARPVVPKLSADVILAKPTSKAMDKTTGKVVMVGASSGGTEALNMFLQSMPLDAPGIVIVQHMPEYFTRAFATRLNRICQISVKEAENNDTVLRGPRADRSGEPSPTAQAERSALFCGVREGPLVNRHRPSVDVLFRSAARYAGKNSIGVIMTGMGDDGAKGMLEMKESGAHTIAQDEESCVVFGMPKKAIELNAVSQVLALNDIPAAVLKEYNKN